MFICADCREPRNDGHVDCRTHRRLEHDALTNLTRVELCGEGGFGRVYECRDDEGLRWALKLLDLRPALRRGPERAADLRGGFVREVSALAGLNHRRIVRYGAHGELGELLFLAMEYVPRRLTEALHGEPWAIDRALEVLAQLADALAYLHARKAAHRDLKPDNLGLDEHAQLKVFDFGLVALRGHGFVARRSTMHGFGTPGYAAPEQLFLDRSDIEADIYAFGALAYELLTGRPHLEGQVPTTLPALQAWYAGRPPPLPRDPDRPPRLDWLVECCLRDAPDQRPTAPQVQEALESVSEWRAAARLHAEQTEAVRAAEARSTQLRDDQARLEARNASLQEALRATERGIAAQRAQTRRPTSARRWMPGPWMLRVAALLSRRWFPRMLATSSAHLVAAEAPQRPAMLAIPGGAFDMGSPEGENGNDNERPVHRVTVSPFWMAETPVTVAQYHGVLGEAFSRGEARLPKVNVSWAEAVDWCNALSDHEGLRRAYAGKDLVPDAEGYRLPTEAEWEYACRAGTTTPWWSGLGEAALANVAWYAANAGGKVYPVAEKQRPNPWGLHDMHGNVWDWCHDWYGSYDATAQQDPTGPQTGVWRVFRGGSFWDVARRVRSARRSGSDPAFRRVYLGFRVVRRPQAPGP